MRDRALELLADQQLAAGDADGAIARYREVSERTNDEDQLRTIDVKTATAKDQRARAAVVALLIGERGRAPDRFEAAELLGAWAQAVPDDGLPHYLLGRQYANAAEYGIAADRLDKSLAPGIAIPRVLTEAERLRMVVACAQSDATAARRLFILYSERPGVSTARRESTRALLERCTATAPKEKK